MAATPVERTAEVAATMGALFDIPCKTIPNFLCLTLTPSNQIIHPARYYGIFRDWDGKRTYKMEVRGLGWGRRPLALTVGDRSCARATV